MMRVRILARMPALGYSGGRLVALTMAESLAMCGAEVDLIADTLPEMHYEFQEFSRIGIKTSRLYNLSKHVDRSVDVCVLVPSQNDVYTHGEFLRHAYECRARTVMINFESPNWFNALSPWKRDVSVWEGWDILSEEVDMIMSISGEGDKWAREYYTRARSDCLFTYSYPAINSYLADKAPDVDEPEKQIVFLTRVDPHKGFNMLRPLAHPDFAGYRVLVFIGAGKVDKREIEQWRKIFREVDMEFDYHPPITGVEKFAMMKRSALNYFPTRFEGFGIPPLEAAYCLCPTACSDLPVLREFGQEAFVYGNPDDEEDMRRAIREGLSHRDKLKSEHERIAEIARLECYGERTLRLLEQMF